MIQSWNGKPQTDYDGMNVDRVPVMSHNRHHEQNLTSRSIFPRHATHSARASNAESIHHTKWLSTRLERRLCLLKEREDTTESSRVMVVKLSLSSTRKPRPQRRLCWDWNALYASTSSNWLSSVASTLNLEVKRRPRVRLCNSKFYCIEYTDIITTVFKLNWIKNMID